MLVKFSESACLAKMAKAGDRKESREPAVNDSLPSSLSLD